MHQEKESSMQVHSIERKVPTEVHYIAIHERIMEVLFVKQTNKLPPRKYISLSCAL